MARKPKKTLTEKGVERLKVDPHKQVDIFDDHLKGFFVKTSPGGSKSFYAMWYQRDASGKMKSRQRLIGKYPVMKVAEAREAARQFLANPQASMARREGEAFNVVVDTFFRRHVDKNELRSAADIKQRVNKHLIPAFRDRDFTKITKTELVELLDDIEEAHGARTADLVLADFRRMASFHAGRVDDYQSPAAGIARYYNARQKRRERTLTDPEIRAVWNAATEAGTYGAMVQFLLLTAQRRDKARFMRFADLQTVHYHGQDYDNVWVIPNEQREKGHGGNLHLPHAALDIIKRQHNQATNEYVFGGMGTGPMNGLSKSKARLDAQVRRAIPDIPNWTLHDLRRTARTLMSRAKVGLVAEKILGHAAGSVEGTYDRWSYFEEKADGLERLSVLIGTILDPTPTTNVVPLHPADSLTA